MTEPQKMPELEYDPNKIFWTVFFVIIALLFVLIKVLEPDDAPEPVSACNKEWTGNYTADGQLLMECLDERGVQR